MTKEEIIAYVCDTPENSNPAVLGSLLDQFAAGQQGSKEVWTISFQTGTGDHGATISNDRASGQAEVDFDNGDMYEKKVFFVAGSTIVSKTAAKFNEDDEPTYAIGWSKTPNGSLVTFPYTPTTSGETLYAVYEN